MGYEKLNLDKEGKIILLIMFFLVIPAIGSILFAIFVPSSMFNVADVENVVDVPFLGKLLLGYFLTIILEFIIGWCGIFENM